MTPIAVLLIWEDGGSKGSRADSGSRSGPKLKQTEMRTKFSVYSHFE